MVVAIVVLCIWNIWLTAVVIGGFMSLEERLAKAMNALECLAGTLLPWIDLVESRLSDLSVEKEVKREMDMRH